MTEPRKKNARDIILGSFWQLMICIPIAAGAGWASSSYSTHRALEIRDKAVAAQQRKDAQTRQHFNEKFAGALRVAVYSINSNACGFEHYGLDAIHRAEKARDDPRSDPRVVAAARATISQTQAFLRTNAVKVPGDFPCTSLSKKPPKAGHP